MRRLKMKLSARKYKVRKRNAISRGHESNINDFIKKKPNIASFIPIPRRGYYYSQLTDK